MLVILFAGLALESEFYLYGNLPQDRAAAFAGASGTKLDDDVEVARSEEDQAAADADGDCFGPTCGGEFAED